MLDNRQPKNPPRRRQGAGTLAVASRKAQAHGTRALLPRIVKIAAGVVAGVSLLTLVAPVIAETIAVFPRPFAGKAANSLTELGLAYEEVSFPTTDDLTLRGWFIPADRRDAPAILYAPATAHDQRSGLSLAPALHEAGYHLLLFSYRGFARSDGRRGEFTYGDAESRDVDAAVRFLYETKGITRLGIVGHSAGAASAILSAARNPRLGAVVAVAPFNSVAEIWFSNRPALVPAFVLDWTLWLAETLRGFDREHVSPLKVVDQIAPRPLLLIYGTADQRISEAQIRRLYTAAREPKALWLVEGASHSGIRTPVLDALAPEVIAFLDNALQDGQKPASGLAHILAGQFSMQ